MKKLLCKIGIHNWEITQWRQFRDKKYGRGLIKEGFDRECKQCEKRQRLKRPVKYHPTKYIWTNIS